MEDLVVQAPVKQILRRVRRGGQLKDISIGDRCGASSMVRPKVDHSDLGPNTFRRFAAPNFDHVPMFRL